MTTTTARVEVLTAEVRVLQVGRRQVTLSVYRQLDRVDPDEIEPFGRVNVEAPSGSWLGERQVEVVGRHVETGALVASSAHEGRPTDPDPPFLTWRELPVIVLAGLR